MDADRNPPLAGVGAQRRAAAVERDLRQPVGRAGSATPASTTAPVRSATNADTGRAESSSALPRWTIRPVLDHRDLVGDRRRLVEVVGDEHGRHGGVAEQLEQRAGGLRPRADVERRERLVEQEGAGVRAQASARGLRAGARRPRASPAGRRRGGRRRSGRAARRRRGAGAPAGGGAGRRRRCARRSCARTARSPGTRSRSGAARAPARRRPRCRARGDRRTRPGRGAVAPARRSSAAPRTCRRPTAPAAPGSGRRARPRRVSSSSSPSVPASSARSIEDRLGRARGRRRGRRRA